VYAIDPATALPLALLYFSPSEPGVKTEDAKL